MECVKRKSRNIFELFEVYDCCNCSNYNEDSSFYLGGKLINIYYLSSCHINESLDYYEVKVLYVLNEIIKNDYSFFWFNTYSDFEENFHWLEFLDFNIIIIDR